MQQGCRHVYQKSVHQGQTCVCIVRMPHPHLSSQGSTTTGSTQKLAVRTPAKICCQSSTTHDLRLPLSVPCHKHYRSCALSPPPPPRTHPHTPHPPSHTPPSTHLLILPQACHPWGEKAGAERAGAGRRAWHLRVGWRPPHSQHRAARLGSTHTCSHTHTHTQHTFPVLRPCPFPPLPQPVPPTAVDTTG